MKRRTYNDQTPIEQMNKEDESEHVTKVQSKWNTFHLSAVSALLAGILLILLDLCGSGSGVFSLCDWLSFSVLGSFTLLQVALYHLPVVQATEGKMGNDGKRIKYKLNGVYALALSVLLLCVLWFSEVFRATDVTKRIFSLVGSGTILSLLISLRLYTHAPMAITYGDRANPLLQFILGSNMDPRFFDIDIKHFLMVRIGFIGWAVMNVVYLLTALEEMDSVPISLLLPVIFQLIYILDFLIDEGSVLTTKEFTEEPIGFIMVLGEFIWIPFFSNINIYFLLQRPNYIPSMAILPISLLFGVGFLIYFLSNGQKIGFRNNPDDPVYAALETIPSPSGKSLLVSGWFGWVRHPNYLGDILMAFAWCLPCGFSSILPYLPALQCLKLLHERANEIEESCLEKHGSAWREYCHRVPYKLVPYIY